MRTCDTCTFWQRHRDATKPPCRYLGEQFWFIPGHGLCSCPKFVDRSQNEQPGFSDDQLSYEDDDGVTAHFQTGPKFGCIHHTEATDVADKADAYVRGLK